MRIALCDDEATQTAYLTQCITSWARRTAHAVQLQAFPSAEAFLFAYAGDANWDLVLLDIQLRAMNGVELAKQLRAQGGDMPIAFVTAHSDFLAEGYDVSALQYLLKPVDETKLAAVLERAAAQHAEPVLCVEEEKGQARIRLRDILCVEAFAHTVSIRTLRDAFAPRIAIGELYTQLDALEPGAFLRCHRSYIVGLRYVERILRSGIQLDDGTRIPLSRRQYEAANRAFIAFYRRDCP